MLSPFLRIVSRAKNISLNLTCFCPGPGPVLSSGFYLHSRMLSFALIFIPENQRVIFGMSPHLASFSRLFVFVTPYLNQITMIVQVSMPATEDADGDIDDGVANIDDTIGVFGGWHRNLKDHRNSA